MLTCSVQPGPRERAWTWDGKRLTDGRSWIDPYPHTLLETAVYDDGQRLLTIVRERLVGEPAAVADVVPIVADEYDRLLVDARTWRGDYVLVEVTPSVVRLTAGVLGNAPLYLAADGPALRASWELLDLRGLASGDRLDALEAARFLTMRTRYSTATLFTDVHRLTERAAATWDSQRLDIAFPEPARHALARPLATDADPDRVLDAYEQLLADALTLRPVGPDRLGVQLSGGLDSANVGLSVATLWPGRATAAAMLLPGPAGAQQRRRRALMTAGGRYAHDVLVPVVESGLTPLAPRWLAEYGDRLRPHDDAQQPATVEMHTALAARGVTTVATGVGGDEMTSVTEEETVTRPAVGDDMPPAPWIGYAAAGLAEDPNIGIAPASVVNEMTLLAHACAAPMLLGSGLWPLHPYGDPTLIRFGESLPVEWRSRKYLHRARLVRAGYGPEVTEPRLRENFGEVMRWALPRNITPVLAEMLTGGSPLIEQGLVDPDGLTATLDRVHAGRPADRDTELYELAAMHLAVAAA